MKIAVESTDGKYLASPFKSSKNYMVFEVTEKDDHTNPKYSGSKMYFDENIKLVNNVSNSQNIINILSECSTVISHGLNRPILNKLKSIGVDIYITFKNRIDDAIEQYLKDKFLHDFEGRTRL